MMDDRGWRFGGLFLLVLLQNGVELAKGRPVLSDSEDSPFVDSGSALTEKDLKFTHVLPLGIVTIATLVSLLVVLVLCVCAEKPERNEEPSVSAVENNGVTPVPSPEAAPDPVPDVTVTVPLNDAPKQRTASVQSANSNPGVVDDSLVRCPTIDRRLPELPPTPMPPVTPTREEDEDDYNRTYDVIGETKTAKTSTQNAATVDDKDDFEEDEQYASVTDTPDKPRFPNVEVGNEVESNGPAGAASEAAEDGCDEPYASVVVNDEKEEENASYASVANKEEKDGYSRLRSVQKHRPKADGAENGERNGYARLRDVTVENAAVGVAVGGAVGGAAAAVPNDDDEVPPVPYKPPDLQNEDEDEQENSAVQRTGNAVSVMATEGSAPASTKRREPPYTQVSARESLEVVRARQQAEQSARIAAHYQTIEEDQNLDADHDGIYEPVDDQQMDGQPVMAPPPLPGERQAPSNEPSASNNWQILRAPRVYEEITEETRPKPPQATPAAAAGTQTDDDDIQPYAVTEKRPTPTDKKPTEQTTEANYAKVNKAAKGPDQINNNAMTEVRVPDQASGPVSENGLPLYAVVEKKGKGKGSKAKGGVAEGRQAAAAATASTSMTVEDNYQAVEDSYQAVDDDYQSVSETPGNGNISAAAIAGGMIQAGSQPTRDDLWTKKEHMYIDVETNQPSSPTETKCSSAGSPRGHSYESVEVAQQATSKKEKAKQAKKAKKEAKRERKHSKGSKASKDKGGKQKESGNDDTVWQRQESTEGNGNSNNNTDPFDDYENIVFPLQETRL